MLGGKVVQESQYVRLNVGGHLYTTTLATLTRKEGMLCSMFSGEVGIKQDSEGYFCIDRDGRLFGLVLDYLRDDHVYVVHARTLQFLTRAFCRVLPSLAASALNVGSPLPVSALAFSKVRCAGTEQSTSGSYGVLVLFSRLVVPWTHVRGVHCSSNVR